MSYIDELAKIRTFKMKMKNTLALLVIQLFSISAMAEVGLKDYEGILANTVGLEDPMEHALLLNIGGIDGYVDSALNGKVSQEVVLARFASSTLCLLVWKTEEFRLLREWMAKVQNAHISCGPFPTPGQKNWDKKGRPWLKSSAAITKKAREMINSIDRSRPALHREAAKQNCRK